MIVSEMMFEMILFLKDVSSQTIVFENHLGLGEMKK